MLQTDAATFREFLFGVFVDAKKTNPDVSLETLYPNALAEYKKRRLARRSTDCAPPPPSPHQRSRCAAPKDCDIMLGLIANQRKHKRAAKPT